MKTYKQWYDATPGTTLDEFLQPGDIVDEEFKMHFLEVLFPACMSERFIQIGEPSEHDEQGRPMFETLKYRNGQWIYIGIKITPPGEKNLYVE